jgi:hypothetical protein
MHSSVNRQDVSSTCQAMLDKYFVRFPNEAMRSIASRALHKMQAGSLSLERSPGSWAGGLIYALNRYTGLQKQVVLNNDLEEIFSARMEAIRHRAEELWPIIESLLLSDNCQEHEFTLRDEANSMCAYAFRNGFIEEIHSSVTSDGHPRITDPEMKRLMIDASTKLFKLLKMKASNPDNYGAFIKDYGQKYCYNWERE